MMNAIHLKLKLRNWKRIQRLNYKCNRLIIFSDTENRQRENREHEQKVQQKREENEKLKKDIKDKLSANFKS